MKDEIHSLSVMSPSVSVSFWLQLFQGLSGRAARRLFELMSEEPPVVAVLGPSLSRELTVVGQITPEYNTLHVS